MMKKLVILPFCILLLQAKLNAQDPIPVAIPYFSAVIVSNIETSSSWYQSLLGLKIKNRINDSAGAYKVVILESGRILLELLELKGSLQKKKLLEKAPEGTQITGHFKFGFSITNVDAWLKHCRELHIAVDRVYVDSPSGLRNFLINDPDGNLIQFFELKQ